MADSAPTPSEGAPPNSDIMALMNAVTSAPAKSAKGYPPYAPYSMTPAPPSVADTINAGHDIRVQHKSMPRRSAKPPPRPARPRGPKATDVKMSKRAMRAHALCLKRHGAILTDRLEKMSKPRRRTVIYLWRENARTLPAYTIARLRNMLDADEPFKPDQAYEYFINLRKTKKKIDKARGVNQIKKDLLAVCADKRFAWARNATVSFARGIQQRLAKPGNYALSDSMLRLSNIVLSEICCYMNTRPPSRRCTHPKAKFLMEMADKIAVWIDDVLTESDDRMLMMDFDEDEEVLGADDEGLAGFTEDFLKMMGGEGGPGGGGAGGPGRGGLGERRKKRQEKPAYTKFKGEMADSFKILTDAMEKKGNEKLIQHEKFSQTYAEGAQELKKAEDFNTHELNLKLADELRGKLNKTVQGVTPKNLAPYMKEMVNICSNYLAEHADNSRHKGPAFKILIEQMKVKPGNPLYSYHQGKSKKNMGEGAAELQKAKGLTSDHDDPNLSQAIHSKLTKTVADVTPDEHKKDMAETLDLTSKYLSQGAVDEVERGPAFDILMEELEKDDARDFLPENKYLNNNSAVVHALKTAPGLKCTQPDPEMAKKIKAALNRVVEKQTPAILKKDMESLIDRCSNYLSEYAHKRDKALKILVNTMKAKPNDILTSRNNYKLSYGTAASELETTPHLAPSFKPVKDISDEINAKLTNDVKDKIEPDMEQAMKAVIKDASDHLSQDVALKSGVAGEKYGMDLLTAVKQSIGPRQLYKHKNYGQTYEGGADELNKAHGMLEKSDEKSAELKDAIKTELDKGVPTKISPHVQKGLEGAMDDAAHHLAKVGQQKGDALEHIVDGMKKKGDEPLANLQGQQQSHAKAAGRIEAAHHLTTDDDDVNKKGYEIVKQKLNVIAKDAPPETAKVMPDVVDEASKYLATKDPDWNKALEGYSGAEGGAQGAGYGVGGVGSGASSGAAGVNGGASAGTAGTGTGSGGAGTGTGAGGAGAGSEGAAAGETGVAGAKGAGAARSSVNATGEAVGVGAKGASGTGAKGASAAGASGGGTGTDAAETGDGTVTGKAGGAGAKGTAAGGAGVGTEAGATEAGSAAAGKTEAAGTAAKGGGAGGADGTGRSAAGGAGTSGGANGVGAGGTGAKGTETDGAAAGVAKRKGAGETETESAGAAGGAGARGADGSSVGAVGTESVAGAGAKSAGGAGGASRADGTSGAKKEKEEVGVGSGARGKLGAGEKAQPLRLSMDGAEESGGRARRRTGAGGGAGAADDVDDPDRAQAQALLHQQLKAHGNEIFYKQPKTELTHSQASDWIKDPSKIDKVTKEAAETTRLANKFERKLSSLVSKHTPENLREQMQDVIIEDSQKLSERFVSKNYNVLARENLISEMQKKKNEILIEVDGAAETHFFAAQRLKKTQDLKANEPCNKVSYQIEKSLDGIIKSRTMPRKLCGTMKEHIKVTSHYLSEHVTKPDEQIEAYVALLNEMEVAGDQPLIEGDIQKSYKESAAYLSQLTSYEDQINRPNAAMQSSVENKLTTLMSNVPASGYSPAMMTKVIKDSTRLLVSYITLQGERTEALKVLIGEMEKEEGNMLLRHGPVRKSYQDGADLLRGKNTDQLAVDNAEPVVARKIQIKLKNLMSDRTPDKYKAIMDDVIEDATLYLAVNLLRPQLVTVCKCMKNVFVQCELWCEEILRRVARPCCTCSRHVSAQALADLAPSERLTVTAGASSAYAPGVSINITPCTSKTKDFREPSQKRPCQAKKPSRGCQEIMSYLLYSQQYERFSHDTRSSFPSSVSPPVRFGDDPSAHLSPSGSPDRSPTYLGTSSSFSDNVSCPGRSDEIQSFLKAFRIEAPNNNESFTSFYTPPNTTRQNSPDRADDTPTRQVSAPVYIANLENWHLEENSQPQQIFSNFSTDKELDAQQSTSTTKALRGFCDTSMSALRTPTYNTRAPIITTDEMSDWHSMMVSLMWNVHAWRQWIQENVDKALTYKPSPLITDESKWTTFERRVTTEAMQWRQYNSFSKCLAMRLAVRYSNKQIMCPSRTEIRTNTYVECQRETLKIIEMFNRWTHWLMAVVKETDSLRAMSEQGRSLNDLQWSHFKLKVQEHADDWERYNMHLKICWERKYEAVMLQWLPHEQRVGPVWVVSACGAVPSGAVAAGVYEGEVTWVARTTHKSSVYPAALLPSKHCCLVYANGGVHQYTKYQVMCNAVVSWAAWRAGEAGARAVHVARGVHVGRVLYRGSHLLGAVRAPHYRCHVVIFGRQFAFSCYELLVLADDANE